MSTDVHAVCVLCSKWTCQFLVCFQISLHVVWLSGSDVTVQAQMCQLYSKHSCCRTWLQLCTYMYVIMYRTSCICTCICISLTDMYINKLSLWKVLNITGISRWVLVVIVFILCWSSELCTYWILLYFVLFSMCRPLCWFGRRVRIWPTYLHSCARSILSFNFFVL